MRFHPLLQCSVRQIVYDWEARTGHVYMPRMNCTDMSGCIAVFKLIDPDVERIYTYEQDDSREAYEVYMPDTAYLRGSGTWRAVVGDGK